MPDPLPSVEQLHRELEVCEATTATFTEYDFEQDSRTILAPTWRGDVVPLRQQLAERDEESCRRWAEEAWKEVRRLHDVCERHWEEKEQIRVAAGLPREAPTIPLAKWDHESRQWVPDT